MTTECTHDWEKGEPRGRITPMTCRKCGASAQLVKPAPTQKCADDSCSGPAIFMGGDEKGYCDRHIGDHP